MRLFRTMRFSLAAIMMLVATAGAASALFAKAREFVPQGTQPYLRFDAPFLFVLSIALTAVALGALKGHTAVQMMLQTMIACLGYLSLIGLAEANMERPLLYWFQVGFGLLVTLPLLARRSVKTRMERGPRRDWWRGTCEAVLFAFFTMMLVLVGLMIEFIAMQATNSFRPATPPPPPAPAAAPAPTPAPAPSPAPIPPTPVDPLPPPIPLNPVDPLPPPGGPGSR